MYKCSALSLCRQEPSAPLFTLARSPARPARPRSPSRALRSSRTPSSLRRECKESPTLESQRKSCFLAFSPFPLLSRREHRPPAPLSNPPPLHNLSPPSPSPPSPSGTVDVSPSPANKAVGPVRGEKHTMALLVPSLSHFSPFPPLLVL